MRIAILAEGRYLAQKQPAGLAAALAARGERVTVIEPDSDAVRLDDTDWLDDFDLVVARGRSWCVLCVLACAEARGIRTINRRRAIAAVHNKSEMGVALARAGVAIPATFVGSPLTIACRAAAARAFPLVVKPVFGDNSQGLHVAWTAEELVRLAPLMPVVMAQSIAAGRFEVKLYGIGGELWAIRRPGLFESFSANGPAGEVQPFAITRPYRQIAERCADVFGLDLYGIDCIDTPTGPVVIEVNDFPNYTGVERAGERLAEFVVRQTLAGRAGRRTTCVSVS